MAAIGSLADGPPAYRPPTAMAHVRRGTDGQRSLFIPDQHPPLPMLISQPVGPGLKPEGTLDLVRVNDPPHLALDGIDDIEISAAIQSHGFEFSDRIGDHRGGNTENGNIVVGIGLVMRDEGCMPAGIADLERSVAEDDGLMGTNKL